MRKTVLLVAVVVGLGLLAYAMNASAHKYQKYKYTPPATDTTAESTTSMSDCMTYSANFQCKGKTTNEADLNRQFGEPMSHSGSMTTYNYDQYTKIILDCPGRNCYTRCLAK